MSNLTSHPKCGPHVKAVERNKAAARALKVDTYPGVRPGSAPTGAVAASLLGVRRSLVATLIAHGFVPNKLALFRREWAHALIEVLNDGTGSNIGKPTSPFANQTVSSDGDVSVAELIEEIKVLVKDIDFCLMVDKAYAKAAKGVGVFAIVLCSSSLPKPILLDVDLLEGEDDGLGGSLTDLIMANLSTYGLDINKCQGLASDGDVCLKGVAKALGVPHSPCLSHHMHQISSIVMSFFPNAFDMFVGLSSCFSSGGGTAAKRSFEKFFSGSNNKLIVSRLQGRGWLPSSFHYLSTRQGCIPRILDTVFSMPRRKLKDDKGAVLLDEDGNALELGAPLSAKQSDVSGVTHLVTWCLAHNALLEKDAKKAAAEAAKPKKVAPAAPLIPANYAGGVVFAAAPPKVPAQRTALGQAHAFSHVLPMHAGPMEGIVAHSLLGRVTPLLALLSAENANVSSSVNSELLKLRSDAFEVYSGAAPTWKANLETMYSDAPFGVTKAEAAALNIRLGPMYCGAARALVVYFDEHVAPALVRLKMRADMDPRLPAVLPVFDDGAPGVDELRKVYGGGCDDTTLRRVWKQHKEYCAAYSALPVKSRLPGRNEVGQDVPALGLRNHIDQSPHDFWAHTAKVVHKWDDLAAHGLRTLEASWYGPPRSTLPPAIHHLPPSPHPLPTPQPPRSTLTRR